MTASAPDQTLTEDDIPRLAVEALTEAHRKARASGRALVYVVNGELVRVEGVTRTVLKKIPTRFHSTTRVKRAKK